MSYLHYQMHNHTLVFACTQPCICVACTVVASEKGVVVGRLTFVEDGDVINCSKMGVGGKAIPPNIDKVSTFPYKLFYSTHTAPSTLASTHTCTPLLVAGCHSNMLSVVYNTQRNTNAHSCTHF